MAGFAPTIGGAAPTSGGATAADFQQQTFDAIRKVSAINPEAGTILANAYANKSGAGSGNFFGNLFGGVIGAVGSTVGTLVEGLSRFGTAITEPFRDEVNDPTSPQAEADPFWEDIWQGLSGKEHTSWSRNLVSWGLLDEDDPLRGPIGLVFDVALDPTTYLVGPAGALSRQATTKAAKELTETGFRTLAPKAFGEEGFEQIVMKSTRNDLITKFGVNEVLADGLAGAAARGAIHEVKSILMSSYDELAGAAGREAAKRVTTRGGLANATADWIDPVLGRKWTAQELNQFVEAGAKLKPQEAIKFAEDVLGKTADQHMAYIQNLPRAAAGALSRGYRMRFGVPFGNFLYQHSAGAVHPFWAFRWQSAELPFTHRMTGNWRNFARGTVYLNKLEGAIAHDLANGVEAGFKRTDLDVAMNSNSIFDLKARMISEGRGARYNEVFGSKGQDIFMAASQKVGGLTEAITPWARATRRHGFMGLTSSDQIRNARAERTMMRAKYTANAPEWAKAHHRLVDEYGGAELPADIQQAQMDYLFEGHDEALDLLPEYVHQSMAEMRINIRELMDEVAQKGGNIVDFGETLAYQFRVQGVEKLTARIKELIDGEIEKITPGGKGPDLPDTSGRNTINFDNYHKLKAEQAKLHEQLGKQISQPQAGDITVEGNTITEWVDAKFGPEWRQQPGDPVGGNVPNTREFALYQALSRGDAPALRKILGVTEGDDLEIAAAAARELKAKKFTPTKVDAKLTVEDAAFQESTAKLFAEEKKLRQAYKDAGIEVAAQGLKIEETDKLLKALDVIEEWELEQGASKAERAAGMGHADQIDQLTRAVEGGMAGQGPLRAYQAAKEEVIQIMKAKGHTGGSLAVEDARRLGDQIREAIGDTTSSAALRGQKQRFEEQVQTFLQGDEFAAVKDEVDTLLRQMDTLIDDHATAEEYEAVLRVVLGDRAVDKLNNGVMYSRRMTKPTRKRAIEALAVGIKGKGRYAQAKSQLLKIERTAARLSPEEAVNYVKEQVPDLNEVIELFETNPVLIYQQYLDELIEEGFAADIGKEVRSILHQFGAVDNSIFMRGGTQDEVAKKMEEVRKEVAEGVVNTRTLVELWHTQIVEDMPANVGEVAEVVQNALETMAKGVNSTRARMLGVEATPQRALLSMDEVPRAWYQKTQAELLQEQPDLPGYYYHGGDDLTGKDIDITKSRPYTFHGFYATKNKDIAKGYADQKYATGTGAGHVNYVKLSDDARVIDFQDSPLDEDLWDEILDGFLPNVEDLTLKAKLKAGFRDRATNDDAMMYIVDQLARKVNPKQLGDKGPLGLFETRMRLAHVVGGKVKETGRYDVIKRTEHTPDDETYEALAVINPKAARIVSPTEVHRKYVEDALGEGRRVPEQVLADYPDLLEQAKKNNQVGGFEPPPGWRPVNVPGLDGVFMPAYIAEEINFAWGGGKPAGEFRQAYRSILLGPWKKWATLYWPGFHARNFQGGLFNNLLGGVGPEHYWISVKMAKASKDEAFADTPLPKRLQLQVDGGPRTLKTWGDLVEIADSRGISGYNSMSILGAYEYSKGADKLLFKRGRPVSRRIGTTTADGREINLGAVLNKWESLGMGAALTTENFHRWAAFAKGLEDTAGDVSAARAFTMVRHGDYDELTEFETNLKDIIPFYKWIRTNVPFQVRQLVEAPGRSMAAVKLGDSLVSEEDRKNLPKWMRHKLVIPFGDVGNGAAFMALDLPLQDAMIGGSEYATAFLPVAKQFLETQVLQQNIQTGAPLKGTRMRKLNDLLAWGPMGFVAEKTGLAKRGADGGLYVTDRQENLLGAMPIYSKVRGFLTSDPNREESRMRWFAGQLTGTQLDNMSEADLTAEEAAFFFDVVQPQLDALRELGFQLPSADDIASFGG